MGAGRNQGITKIIFIINDIKFYVSAASLFEQLV